MQLLEPKTEEQFDAVRRLMSSYIAEMGFSPNTTTIFEDLGNLPGRYARPRGRLLLAVLGDKPVGCAALAEAINTEHMHGELKRLYVRPEHRGAGIGEALAKAIIADARDVGYQRLLLSARASWKPAIGLFEKLGFAPTEPFKDVKPVDLVFMGLDLSEDDVMKSATPKTPLVFKVSGSDLDDPEFAQSLTRQLALLWKAGKPLLLVHGGGKELTELLKTMQIPSQFINGLRVTTREARDAALMVFAGLANKRLVASFMREGVVALGVCGADGGIVRVERVSDELQFVGKPVSVRGAVIESWIAAGSLPILSPIGLGMDGEMYNVNADHVAGAIAAAMNAPLLTFITNVRGVLDADKNLIPRMTKPEVEALIASGVISGGMIPKVRTALEALDAGVRRVRITNLQGLGENVGTVFTEAQNLNM